MIPAIDPDKHKDPPKSIVRLANIVFILGAIFSALSVVYAISKIYDPTNNRSQGFYLICIAIGTILTIAFGISVKKLSNKTKTNLSLVLLALATSFYGFEAYLVLELGPTRAKQAQTTELTNIRSVRKTQVAQIVGQTGIPYDNRTKIQVLQDLRTSGLEAYPNINSMTNYTPTGGEIVNIGGISNITTILNNESGYYPIITTDEYGFNNPTGLYTADEVDILMTGDSFAEGYSVQSDENIGAILRSSGYHTISIGKNNNGSLVEYAALREYASSLRPKVVLWLYYGNDIDNIISETESHILTSYLFDDNFTQDLISRQDEIDSILKHYAQQQWNKQFESPWGVERASQMTLNLITLSNSRALIGLQPPQMYHPDVLSGSPHENCASGQEVDCLIVFRDILNKSKTLVSSWQGHLYFVYLPGNTSTMDNALLYKDLVISTAKELGITVIDIHEEVFKNHPDPLSLFPFRSGGHYTAEGYRLVSEAILSNISLDIAIAN